MSEHAPFPHRLLQSSTLVCDVFRKQSLLRKQKSNTIFACFANLLLVLPSSSFLCNNILPHHYRRHHLHHHHIKERPPNNFESHHFIANHFAIETSKQLEQILLPEYILSNSMTLKNGSHAPNLNSFLFNLERTFFFPDKISGSFCK